MPRRDRASAQGLCAGGPRRLLGRLGPERWVGIGQKRRWGVTVGKRRRLGCDGERGPLKGRPAEWVLKAGVKHVGFVPRGLGSYTGSRQEKIRRMPWKGVSGCLVWETQGPGALRLGWAS